MADDAPKRALAALKKIQDEKLAKLEAQVEGLGSRVRELEEAGRIAAAVEAHKKETTGAHRVAAPAPTAAPQADSPDKMLRHVAPWIMGLIGIATVLGQIILKLVG